MSYSVRGGPEATLTKATYHKQKDQWEYTQTWPKQTNSERTVKEQVPGETGAFWRMSFQWQVGARPTMTMVRFSGTRFLAGEAGFTRNTDRPFTEKPFPDKTTLVSQMPTSFSLESLRFQQHHFTMSMWRRLRLSVTQWKQLRKPGD